MSCDVGVKYNIYHYHSTKCMNHKSSKSNYYKIMRKFYYAGEKNTPNKVTFTAFKT